MEEVKRIWINENVNTKEVFIGIVKEDGTALWFVAYKYIIRRECD